MVSTLDMQDIRYINLFEKITRVRTRFCFKYNEMIVFCVPKHLLTKAIGDKGANIRKMSEILRKKIRVVAYPEGEKNIGEFIKAIVDPVIPRNIEVSENEIVVSGGKNKAALIGRNKRRLHEMQKVSKDFFGKEFRIA